MTKVSKMDSSTGGEKTDYLSPRSTTPFPFREAERGFNLFLDVQRSLFFLNTVQYTVLAAVNIL